MSEQPYIYRYVDVEIAIATATEQERERIITLIREAQRAAMSKNGGYSKEVAEAFGQEWPLVTGWKDQLIALIRGEQK